MPRFVDAEWTYTEVTRYKARIEVPEDQDPATFLENLLGGDRDDWLPAFEDDGTEQGYNNDRGEIEAVLVPEES